MQQQLRVLVRLTGGIISQKIGPVQMGLSKQISLKPG